jgi:hypothetical protein
MPTSSHAVASRAGADIDRISDVGDVLSSAIRPNPWHDSTVTPWTLLARNASVTFSVMNGCMYAVISFIVAS